MGAVAAVATKVLAPSVGSLVGSIAGDIGQKALGTVTGGALGGSNPLDLISKAFEKLFGRPQSTQPHMCHQRPLPFSPAPGFPLGNPLGALREHQAAFQSLMQQLQKCLGVLQGNAPAAAGAAAGAGQSSATTSATSTGASQFGRVDSLMNQAEQIMNNPNATEADKLKAQKLMSEAQNLFQMFSRFIQQIADFFSTAIRNSKVN